MHLDSWSLMVLFEFVIFLVTFPLLVFGWLMGAKGRNPIRDGPFESGQTRLGEARLRYMMQYYPYLIMFVVFDVVTMFLFTWGLAFSALPFSQDYLFLAFLVILVTPLTYALYLSGKRELW
ncbi:NADH-quinone oxidoreductase subunit A [[Eubacterium] cellulosolvens]